MRKNERQVKFYCSEGFFKRLDAEKLKRDITLQEMIMDALTIYFKTPTEWDHAVTTFYTHQARRWSGTG